MTAKEHQSDIALALANKNLNMLIAELAAKCAEIDTLKAELEAFKAKTPVQVPYA